MFYRVPAKGVKLVVEDAKSTLKKEPPNKFYDATDHVPADPLDIGLKGEFMTTVAVAPLVL